MESGVAKLRSTTEGVPVGRAARGEEHDSPGTGQHYVFRTARRIRGGITAHPVLTPAPRPWQGGELILSQDSMREALYSFEFAQRGVSELALPGSFHRRTYVPGVQEVDIQGDLHGQIWSGQMGAVEMQKLPSLIDLSAVLADMPSPDGIELLYEGRPVAGAEFWKLALSREAQARIINGVTELVEWLVEQEQLRNAMAHGLVPALELASTTSPAAPGDVAFPTPTGPITSTDISGAAGAQADAALEEALRAEHPQLLATYREANALELREVVARLRELFPTKELAYMANASTRTVRNWLAGSVEQARPEAASRLRAALTCLLILQQEERPSVIKNWFTNTNPYLDFHAPAQVIRAGRLREAIKAARVYAEYAGA